MAQGSTDLRPAAVDRRPEALEPDDVAREGHRPREIGDDEARFGHAELAVAERDEAVDGRSGHRASDTELAIGASASACHARECAQQPQIERRSRREIDRLRPAEHQAAAQCKMIVAASPIPIGNVDASVPHEQTRRPLLIERHAGQGEFRSGERHCSIHAVERRSIGLKRDRCIDPALELFECGRVGKRLGDPRRQR